MPTAAILLPLFVEVALTFGVLFWLGPNRIGAIRAGTVEVKDVALGQKVWPECALKVGNSFDNQFQLPVLFYLLTILAFVTQKAGLAFLLLAWAFVISRLVHAYIHTGSNAMQQRFYAYVAGTAVLSLMWIAFAIQILFGL
jgi:hypothetical protein